MASKAVTVLTLLLAATEGCDLWVNSTSASRVAAASCGSAPSTPCGSLQEGIDAAAEHSTVCVTGTFGGCPAGGFLATVDKALTLSGQPGARIDCGGSGGGIKITSPPSGVLVSVRIQGLQFANMVAYSSWTAQYGVDGAQGCPGGLGLCTGGVGAGAIWASGVKSLTVSRASFHNCTGSGAGAIAVHSSGSWRDVSFKDLVISDCHGNRGALSGGAGGISISHAGNTAIDGQKHSFTNVSVVDCTGGSSTTTGGGAGGISISYYAKSSWSNTHEFSDVSISNCSGGDSNPYGGGSGGIAISYESGVLEGEAQHNNWNLHEFTRLRVINCSGGSRASMDGGAGGISISYKNIDAGMTQLPAHNNHNHHIFKFVTLEGCRGGNNLNTKAVGAGGIAINYHSGAGSGSASNSHTFLNLTAINCAGGSNRAGGAGAVAIVYNSDGGSNSNNHEFKNLHAMGCIGGGYTSIGGSCTGSTDSQGSCAGGAGAGAVSITFKPYGGTIPFSNNKISFDSSTVLNCTGGNDADYGGAGGIAVSYPGASAWNEHQFTNMRVTECKGGNAVQKATGAGGISVAFNTGTGGFGVSHTANSQSFENVTIAKCDGGLYGGAGGIAISSSSGSNQGHENRFKHMRVADCTGGNGAMGKAGSGAGGISISYYSSSTSSGNFNNTQSFDDVTVSNCRGGVGSTAIGGVGAGGIALSYYGAAQNNEFNKHRFNDVHVAGCNGGSDARSQGAKTTFESRHDGAGGIAISFIAKGQGSNSNNDHIFTNGTLMDCYGGHNITGLGSGGASIGYYTEYTNDNNSHHFRSMKLARCTGGDWTQGAGALALSTGGAGVTTRFKATLQGCDFEANTGGSSEVDFVEGIGAAGGVRIALSQARAPAVEFVDTTFTSNNLRCATRECLAGGLAITGSNTTFDNVTFTNNSSPTLAGALQCDSHVDLLNCSFAGNSALIFGAASLGSAHARNTRFSLPNQTLALKAAFSSNSDFVLTCPRGMSISTTVAPKATEYSCVRCPEGHYNLDVGVMAHGAAVSDCKPCPSSDTTRVICSGGSDVKAQPGYFVGFADEQGSRRNGQTLQVSKCPNSDACGGGSVDDDQCKEGYLGTMCALCSGRWYSPATDPLTCNTCPNAALSVTFAIVKNLGILLLAAYSATGRAELAQANRSELSSLLKMAMAHTTILSTVIHVDWAWEGAVRRALHLSSSASGSITDLDMGCLYGSGFQTQFYFGLILPYALATIIVLACILMCGCRRSPFGGFRTTLSTLAVLSLYTYAPFAIGTLLMAFPCYDGVVGSMMVYNPGESCWHDTRVFVSAAVGLLVMVSAVAWRLGFCLVSQRHAVTEAMGCGDEAVHRELRVKYGFLFLGYKPEYYYWELWVFSRKCGLLTIVMLTPPTLNLAGRTILMLFLMLFSVMLQMHCRPYAEKTSARRISMHTMEVLTQSLSLSSLLLAVYVAWTESSNPTGHESGQHVATVVFIVLNLSWVVLLTSRGLKPAIKQLRNSWQKVESFTEKIRESFELAKSEEQPSGTVSGPLLEMSYEYTAFEDSADGAGNHTLKRGPSID